MQVVNLCIYYMYTSGLKDLLMFTPILGKSNLFIPRTLMTHMLEDVSSIKCMVISKPLKKRSFGF